MPHPLTSSAFALAALAGLALPGCFLDAPSQTSPPPMAPAGGVTVGSPGAEVSTTYYTPEYYNGYVVYYDDYGRPVYYVDGSMYYIPSTYAYYSRYVNHYHAYRPYYSRWYRDHGYRYRAYRHHSYRGRPTHHGYSGHRGGYGASSPSYHRSPGTHGGRGGHAVPGHTRAPGAQPGYHNRPGHSGSGAYGHGGTGAYGHRGGGAYGQGGSAHGRVPGHTRAPGATTPPPAAPPARRHAPPARGGGGRRR